MYIQEVVIHARHAAVKNYMVAPASKPKDWWGPSSGSDGEAEELGGSTSEPERPGSTPARE